eukprot:3396708-Amphidinium_carterae.1
MTTSVPKINSFPSPFSSGANGVAHGEAQASNGRSQPPPDPGHPGHGGDSFGEDGDRRSKKKPKARRFKLGSPGFSDDGWPDDDEPPDDDSGPGFGVPQRRVIVVEFVISTFVKAKLVLCNFCKFWYVHKTCLRALHREEPVCLYCKEIPMKQERQPSAWW